MTEVSDTTAASSDETTTTAAADDGAEEFKVAFVYVGPSADKGWSWAHDQGAKYLESNMPGVQITTLENIAEGPDSQRVFEDLAADGNQLIFGTSFGYMDPMLAAAENYPDVAFMHATGYKTGPTWATTSVLPKRAAISPAWQRVSAPRPT